MVGNIEGKRYRTRGGRGLKFEVGKDLLILEFTHRNRRLNVVWRSFPENESSHTTKQILRCFESFLDLILSRHCIHPDLTEVRELIVVINRTFYFLFYFQTGVRSKRRQAVKEASKKLSVTRYVLSAMHP
jgi:hypothetical protein